MNKTFSMAALALAASLALGPAHAQDDARLRDLERRLEQSQRLIEALQVRLDQMEKKSGAGADAAPGQWGARISAVEQSVAQIEAARSAASSTDTGLPLHGFADIGAGVRNKAAAGNASRGFNVGVFDLYMTPQISAQVKGLVEIAFEYEGSGELAVDAERLQLGYVFSDALTLWGGRFHTPYGYWNTAFHHGAQIQTALSRPRFLEFEDAGGVLPAHSVGLWATGALRSGIGRVGYDLYVVNGNRIHEGVLDFQAPGDGDGNVGVGLRAQLTPTGTGLTVGVHAMRQSMSGENGDGSRQGAVRLAMLGVYATWDDDDWEAMAEAYRFRNRDRGDGATHGSTAWYAQLGRNVGERWTPYVRVERASLAAEDPYFALQDNARSYRRTVAGVRYHLTPKSALKAEWMRSSYDGTPGHPASVSMQYSVRF